MGIKGSWAQLGHGREEMESQPFLSTVQAGQQSLRRQPFGAGQSTEPFPSHIHRVMVGLSGSHIPNCSGTRWPCPPRSQSSGHQGRMGGHGKENPGKGKVG